MKKNGNEFVVDILKAMNMDQEHAVRSKNIT